MITAAIVGLGWWGRTHVTSTHDSARLRITRAVDPDIAGSRDFADVHGLALSPEYGDALADESIDAVILATPHTLHTEQVVAAAHAGKHVFVEKPFAMSKADAQRQVAACREANVELGIGLVQRFAPPHHRIRELLVEGNLGMPLHGEANVSHDVLLTASAWRRSAKEAPAGGLHHTGTHLIDLYVWMLGPVREVYAIMAGHVFENDTASALLTFEGGQTAYVGDVMATAEQRYFQLFASEGWARRISDTELVLRRRGGEPEVETFAPVDLVRANNDAFADAVMNVAPYPISTDHMIHNVAVLDAIMESVRTGRPASVDRDIRE